MEPNGQAREFSPVDPVMGPDVLRPNPKYLKFVTVDNHEFLLRLDLAMKHSPIVHAMMGDSECVEIEEYRLEVLREYKSHTVAKLCMYFNYLEKYNESPGVVPEFPIQPAEALDLMLIGNFFQL
jgi:hypothetical protein